MDTKQIIEAIKSLENVSFDERRALVWAVEGVRPATQRDADATLKDVVTKWWDTHTDAMDLESVTQQEDWFEALPSWTAAEFVEDTQSLRAFVEFVEREYGNATEEEEEGDDLGDVKQPISSAATTWEAMWNELLTLDDDFAEVARKFVEDGDLEDEFEAWVDSKNEIIWSTVWQTSYKGLADAARAVGLVVMDARQINATDFRAQWVIGSGSAGHSFLADYFIPIYFLCNPEKRAFYTVDEGATFSSL
jgi:hypothetical protein